MALLGASFAPRAAAFASRAHSRAFSARLWEVFSAQRRAERRAALGEELRRGYFDDLRDLKADGGKHASSSLLSDAHTSMPFPALALVDAHGQPAVVPAPGFVSLVFRAGAQRAADGWTTGIAEALGAHPGALSFAQLSLVESWLFGLPGLRQLVLRAGARPPLPGGLGSHVFLFGSAEALRRQLGLHNRLTAHVVLLDTARRVRWKASGQATPAELETAKRLAAQMLVEQGRIL